MGNLGIVEKIRVKYNSISIGIKATFWFMFCNLIQKTVAFITVPIFTRILPTEEYGIFSIYNSWHTIISIFTTLSLHQFVFNKGIVKYKEDQDTFVVSLQCLSLTVTAGFFVIYLIFADSINKYVELTNFAMICMFAKLFTEPSISYWIVKQRFEYKYKSLIIITLCTALLNPVLGIFFVQLISTDAIYRIFADTITTVLFGGAFIIYFIKKSGHMFSTKYWKYALTFNLPLIPHFLSAAALNQADHIMIGRMTGTKYAAIYSVAYSVGIVTIIIFQSMQQTMLPWLYNKLKKNSYSKIIETFNFTLFVVAGFNLFFILFAPEIVHIMGMEDYQSAVWVISPVCASVFYMYLFNLFANIEYYFEETKLIGVVSVVVALLNIVLNYIFIKLFGYLAAGYTTLFSYIVFAIIHYFLMRSACIKHEFKKKIFDYRTIVIISVLFLIISLLIQVLYPITLLRYLVAVLIFMILVASRKRIVSLISLFRER